MKTFDVIVVGSGTGRLPYTAALDSAQAGTALDAVVALAQLAAMSYNHPARAEELLNAVESLAARWGSRSGFSRRGGPLRNKCHCQVFRRKR